MVEGIANKKQFSIYLDEEDYNKLVSLAKEDDRNLVSYVRIILKNYLKKVG